MRSILLRLEALAVLLVAAAPASASAALTASDVRIGVQPGFVRVVVDFTGGEFEINEADATDPRPADGGVRVDIRRPGIRAAGFDRRAHGVRARVRLASAGRAQIRLTSRPGRFKYVRLAGLHDPERLVIDLYLRAPPSPAAEIRVGRLSCLTLTRVRGQARAFRVIGTERDLFEGSFALRVRDARGRVVGNRLLTARGDFDRYVPYRVPQAQAGTVEAVAASAKDGSLACLVQVRVRLAP